MGVTRELNQDQGDKSNLEEQLEDLQKKLQEAVGQSKAVEAEVLRERQRRDMEEELLGQSPDEQKVILEAHGKKARIRVEAIESQIAGLQAEAQDRKAAIERAQETKRNLIKQVDDAQLQM